MAALPPLNKVIEITDLREVPRVFEWASQNAYQFVSQITEDQGSSGSYYSRGSGRQHYVLMFTLNMEAYHHMQEADLLDDPDLAYLPRDQGSTNNYADLYQQQYEAGLQRAQSQLLSDLRPEYQERLRASRAEMSRLAGMAHSPPKSPEYKDFFKL
jgi:hypothetical protein